MGLVERMTNKIGIITQCYGQPKMLHRWMQVHSCWDKGSRGRVADIVVADDCGDPPVTRYDIELLIRHFPHGSLLRVDEDIPWNQPGARNMAMAWIEADVVIMLDVDMVIPPAMAKGFLDEAARLPEGKVIKFALKCLSNGKSTTTSPNTWMLHRSDFFEVGGYDEGYAGHKGYSDVALMHTLRSRFNVVERESLVANWYDKAIDGIDDHQVNSLDRDYSHNWRRHKRQDEAVKARYGGKWYRLADVRKEDPVKFKFHEVMEWGS